MKDKFNELDVWNLQIKHNGDMKKVHDELFGEGSWQEIEGGFEQRYPYLFKQFNGISENMATEHKKKMNKQQIISIVICIACLVLAYLIWWRV